MRALGGGSYHPKAPIEELGDRKDNDLHLMQ